MTKAIGALVSVLAVSILSMGAIAMLLGGFYKGKRRVDLDELSHGDKNSVKPVSPTRMTLVFYFSSQKVIMTDSS